MFRFITFAFAMLSLTACGGVLAYERSNEIFIGPLANINLNDMRSSGQLQSLGSFSDMQYAIDRNGKMIGICRTQHPNLQDENNIIAGDMDFNVYTILRQRSISVSHEELAKKIDSFASTPYESFIDGSPVKYLHCYHVGASNSNSQLVLYLQLQGAPEPGPKTAVLVDVSGTTLKILDVESFSRHGSPVTVIARDNPTKGNTVGIANGVIEINGSPVVLNNGSAVVADSVKHQFE